MKFVTNMLKYKLDLLFTNVIGMCQFESSSPVRSGRIFWVIVIPNIVLNIINKFVLEMCYAILDTHSMISALTVTNN